MTRQEELQAAFDRARHLKWGDRVRFCRPGNRHNERLGTYRSISGDPASPHSWHNILWDGRKTVQRVPAVFFKAVSVPRRSFDELVPRDVQDCFWCKYLDHSQPACLRHAPRPRVGTGDANTSDDSNMAEWPWVSPYQDWCGEFEEGNVEHTNKREPRDTDLNYAGVKP